MTVLEAAIYGLVQGLTEFLPVSSSGHLALYGGLIGQEPSEALAFSVLVHAASLIAVVIVFRREVLRLFGEDRRLGLWILIGTVPAVVAGLALRGVIERELNRPVPAAVCLLVTGLVLAAAELVARRRAAGLDERGMGLGRVLAVGIAQAFALLPGVSRSGMTISAGRALGLTRDASVRFAFLLAVPAIAGAACYELLKIVRGAPMGVTLGPAAAGFAVSLVSSWLALVLLIRLVRRVGLWVFSPYCFAVGVAALIYFSRG